MSDELPDRFKASSRLELTSVATMPLRLRQQVGNGIGVEGEQGCCAAVQPVDASFSSHELALHQHSEPDVPHVLDMAGDQHVGPDRLEPADEIAHRDVVPALPVPLVSTALLAAREAGLSDLQLDNVAHPPRQVLAQLRDLGKALLLGQCTQLDAALAEIVA